jgi:methyl-accepting chemotaxis protein
VYVDDIDAAVATDVRRLVLEIGLAGILLTGLILLVRRQVTRPLARMTALLQDSDLRQRLDEGGGRTELCRLAAAVNKNLATVSEVVDGVITTAGQVSEHVGALGAGAQEIDAQAARTSEQAEEVATSSRAVVTGYDEVATAVSEIDTSIRTIAENVQHVASVVTDAVEATNRTNEVVTRLDASSAEIGAVVATITSIAEQTNMLALNATIESARAGEAGKGFAVVATEVKDLAQETARATEDISRRVQTLQDDARESVNALGHIAEVIGQVNEYQGGIAAAVEEQSVTMSQVNRSVSESSQAGAGTGESIGEVAHATAETRRALDQVSGIIDSLRAVSGHLEETVGVFRR